MEKLKVGQIVYLKPINNKSRYITDDIIDHIEEATVEKIGNKFFYLKGHRKTKFSIEYMCEDSDYVANWRVYTPRRINNETRWLEIAKIKQKYCELGWTDYEFVD